MQFLRTIIFSKDEARLRAGWRILAHLLILFLLGTLLSIPTLALASLSPIFAFIGDGFLIGLIGITLSVYIARRWLDKRGFQSLGLHWDSGLHWGRFGGGIDKMTLVLRALGR